MYSNNKWQSSIKWCKCKRRDKCKQLACNKDKQCWN